MKVLCGKCGSTIGHSAQPTSIYIECQKCHEEVEMRKIEKVRDGLNIFIKNGYTDTCAEHDELFVHGGSEIEDPDDLTALEELDWILEDDSWKTFT